MKPQLGVCYYPEHWPEARWPDDARRMRDIGLSIVRIGEFAWSRLEPEPGRYDFDWLGRAMDRLAEAGLGIVLGTPSAAPPRWMVTRHPDMLAVDAAGRPRGFGSRRHYCFSHDAYRAEAAAMAERLSRTFGTHPALIAWQTDNEYGWDDTVISYSAAARDAFRHWCADRYGDIATLNAAWGTVFWSMEYPRFDDIDLPNLTVGEPNPAHVMAFRRFASAQVERFNQAQCAAIRAHSERPISHNYMGRITSFDHFAVGRQIEIATWDNSPLGFLEDRIKASDAHRRRYARQGDPDFQAFHHDLYRGVGRGRMWVMEQQPGPVNWAPHNPDPLPGMARFWALEAFAHGAEAVLYFRWRQLPFGQEQMHAGLLRPDDVPAPAYQEVEALGRELAALPDAPSPPSPVALVFDYDSAFGWQVQPQGHGCDYLDLVFDVYRALRRLGVSVDVIPQAQADLGPYRLVIAPGLLTVADAFRQALDAFQGVTLLGPRTGAKTPEFAIPVPLPPALAGLDVVVTRVETLRDDMQVPAGAGAVKLWREFLDGGAAVVHRTEDGVPLLMRSANRLYLGGWPDDRLAEALIAPLLTEVGIKAQALPAGIRIRDHGDTRFIFNHEAYTQDVAGHTLPPAGVAIRRR